MHRITSILPIPGQQDLEVSLLQATDKQGFHLLSTDVRQEEKGVLVAGQGTKISVPIPHKDGYPPLASRIQNSLSGNSKMSLKQD